MINNIEFSERLKILMKHYGLTATALADAIDVQRSSISHLLSGRNKPSLDFVLKILQKFPDVELYWLLNGKGSFPDKNKIAETPTLFSKKTIQKKQEQINSETKEKNNTENSEIEKIVIFYKNGTFKYYTP